MSCARAMWSFGARYIDPVHFVFLSGAFRTFAKKHKLVSGGTSPLFFVNRGTDMDRYAQRNILFYFFTCVKLFDEIHHPICAVHLSSPHPLTVVSRSRPSQIVSGPVFFSFASFAFLLSFFFLYCTHCRFPPEFELI